MARNIISNCCKFGRLVDYKQDNWHSNCQHADSPVIGSHSDLHRQCQTNVHMLFHGCSIICNSIWLRRDCMEQVLQKVTICCRSGKNFVCVSIVLLLVFRCNEFHWTSSFFLISKESVFHHNRLSSICVGGLLIPL